MCIRDSIAGIKPSLQSSQRQEKSNSLEFSSMQGLSLIHICVVKDFRTVVATGEVEPIVFHPFSYFQKFGATDDYMLDYSMTVSYTHLVLKSFTTPTIV